MAHTESMSVPKPSPNMALNLAPFGRWTLRDKAAPSRLALRWASAFSRPTGHSWPGAVCQSVAPIGRIRCTAVPN